MSPSNGPMVSEVSICNQALTWLGQDPITSLSDSSTTAEWMRNNYPFIRDAVVESRMWTFATVRATSTTSDRDGWDAMYAHQKPDGWLSVFRVYRNVTAYSNQIDTTWRLESDKVLSSQSTIYMWGINQVTDTGKFTPLFVEALAARIAADACIPLTENARLQRDMWGLFEAKLAEAAARDGQQGSNELIESNSLITARGGHAY